MRRIVIFDFDGTLCNTPHYSLENIARWEKVNGRKWPYTGTQWWAKIESLCLDTFTMPLNEEVRQAALEAIEDPETFTVLLTGRIPRLQKKVKEILHQVHNLPYFDAYFFNDETESGVFKMNKMDYLREEFPEVTEFEMWEDRVKHIPFFAAWGIEHYGKNFKMNIV